MGLKFQKEEREPLLSTRKRMFTVKKGAGVRGMHTTPFYSERNHLNVSKEVKVSLIVDISLKPKSIGYMWKLHPSLF